MSFDDCIWAGRQAWIDQFCPHACWTLTVLADTTKDVKPGEHDWLSVPAIMAANLLLDATRVLTEQQIRAALVVLVEHRLVDREGETFAIIPEIGMTYPESHWGVPDDDDLF